MKQTLVCLAILATVFAGRLDNQYLPANSRQTSATQYPTPSRQYIPSSVPTQYRAPSREYNVPNFKNISPTRNLFTQAIQRGLSNRQYLIPNTQYSTPNSQYSGSATTRQYSAPAAQNLATSRQYLTPKTQYSAPSNQYSGQTVTRQYSASVPQNVATSRQYLAPTTQYSAPANNLAAPTVQYSPQNGHSVAPAIQTSAAYGQQYSANQYSQASYNQVPIVRSINNPNAGEGSYSYDYETANGISAEEQGSYGAAKGGFSYTSPEGEQISLQYTADENGFHPVGSHIPVAPPIPEEIQRSIQQNLAEEAKGGYRDGTNQKSYDSVTIDANQNSGYRY